MPLDTKKSIIDKKLKHKNAAKAAFFT